MDVLKVKYSGFCPGIRSAVKWMDEEAVRGAQPFVVFGELINNKEYIRHLESKGIRTVEDASEVPESHRVAIRIAGIDRCLESRLRERFETVDLTCSIVKKLQNDVAKYSDEGYFIVITGKRKHPEVLGLVSYAKESFVVETESDLDELYAILDSKSREPGFKLCVLSQTTAERKFFETVSRSIEDIYRGHFEIVVRDTICPVTDKREESALATQSKADISFVVGDRISSNASKLFKRLANNKPDTYFVSNLKELKDLNLDLKRFKTAMVVSSSSTPDFIESEIVAYLESIRNA